MPAARLSGAPALVVALGLALATGARAAGPGPLDLVGRAGERVPLALGPGERGLVVHFWATWCADCKSELPALGRASRACEGAGVRVVTVNVGESAETIAGFEAQQEIPLPVLRDPDGRSWRRFARGLPANLVWTAASQRSEVGPLDEAGWRSKLAALGCVAAPR